MSYIFKQLPKLKILSFIISIALAFFVSLGAHDYQIRNLSAVCERAEPEFREVYRQQHKILKIAREQALQVSKKFNGSSARIFFYDEEYDNELLITEDLNPNFTEVPLGYDQTALAGDDFYQQQLDVHQKGIGQNGFFVEIEDVRDGITKQQLQGAGVKWVASAPILDSRNKPGGYFSINFSADSLPASPITILEEMTITAYEFTEELF